MTNALIWLGRHGKLCLIAGLVAGFAFPGLAQRLTPWIGMLIALLLVVTASRVGARRALGEFHELGPALLRIGLLQFALPLGLLGGLMVSGTIGLPIALAVAMMLSAPSITGAPNFAAMVGDDPAPGLRILVISTVLFPLSALPVLTLADLTESGVTGALTLSGWLLLAVLGSVAVGFAIRRAVPQLGDARAQGALDGIAAFLLALAVVGLMSAIGPLVRDDPGTLLLWLIAAIAVNFGLVLATFFLGRRLGLAVPVATAIYAGNRNIALFLIVLPPEVAAPVMIFIGCYQIPMYLTPLLLSRLRDAAH